MIKFFEYYKHDIKKSGGSMKTNTIARPKKRKKSHITVHMYPIDDMEMYKKSLGTVMIDILEKQLGSEVLRLYMEDLQKKLVKN